MRARSDQVMELLRSADPAPATLDDESKSAGYRRLRAAIGVPPPAPSNRATRRRPSLRVLAASVCIAVLAAVLVVIVRPRRHIEATQSPNPARAQFTVSVDGKACRLNQTVPMVAGQKYRISVRATMPAGSHITAFEVIVAGNNSGTSGGRPVGNFDPVAQVPHPQDSLTATGSWTARSMGGPAWIEAVYSTIDRNGSVGTGQTLVNLQVR